MLISIIIVNHNTGNVLKECITSLFEKERADLFEVIIVDNNSKDDSRQIMKLLASQRSNIKLRFLDKDWGFSYANNKGLESAAGEYVLIMNPDIIFTESILPGLIKNFSQESNLGAVCPALLGVDKKFQFNYFQRYPSLIQYLLFHSLVSEPFRKSASLINRYLENHDIITTSKSLQIVEQIPCAFLLTKRYVFEEVGKMDERYFLFFEDVDLCYQINKKYKLAVDPGVKVTHLGGSSIRNENNWWVYGRFIISMNLFFDKNYNRFKSFMLKAITIKNSLLIIFIEYLKRFMGKSDSYRLKKHIFFLGEFRKQYLGKYTKKARP
jgi:GT2 family glycosyltransferase